MGGAETDICIPLRVAKIVPEDLATLGLFGKLNSAKEDSAGGKSDQRKFGITHFYIGYLCVKRGVGLWLWALCDCRRLRKRYSLCKRLSGRSSRHLLSPLECGCRRQCRNHITLIAGIESIERGAEVRTRAKGDRASGLDVADRLVWSQAAVCHQKHRHTGGRSLHSCCAVYKNRLASLVFARELQDDFI